MEKHSVENRGKDMKREVRNASESKIMTRFYGGEVALGRTIFFAVIFCGMGS